MLFRNRIQRVLGVPIIHNALFYKQKRRVYRTVNSIRRQGGLRARAVLRHFAMNKKKKQNKPPSNGEGDLESLTPTLSCMETTEFTHLPKRTCAFVACTCAGECPRYTCAVEEIRLVFLFFVFVVLLSLLF